MYMSLRRTPRVTGSRRQHVPGKPPRQWTRYRYTHRLAWFTCNRTSGSCCFTRYIFRMLVPWPIAVCSYSLLLSCACGLFPFLSLLCVLACLYVRPLSLTHTYSLSLPPLSLLLVHICIHSLSHSLFLSLVFPVFHTGRCVVHFGPLSLSLFSLLVSCLARSPCLSGVRIFLSQRSRFVLQ